MFNLSQINDNVVDFYWLKTNHIEGHLGAWLHRIRLSGILCGHRQFLLHWLLLPWNKNSKRRRKGGRSWNCGGELVGGVLGWDQPLSMLQGPNLARAWGVESGRSPGEGAATTPGWLRA
jgi:hypothetical protein